LLFAANEAGYNEANMTEDQLRGILNEELAKFTKQVNRRYDELESRLSAKADKKVLERMYKVLDTILADLTTEQPKPRS
jgi:uncharacterized FlaG/YvyC family protein